MAAIGHPEQSHRLSTALGVLLSRPGSTAAVGFPQRLWAQVLGIMLCLLCGMPFGFDRWLLPAGLLLSLHHSNGNISDKSLSLRNTINLCMHTIPDD